MNDDKEQRIVTLRQSSWELLDAAASMENGSLDEILDSVVQSFLQTDGGEAVARREAVAKLKKLFGDNRG